VFRPAKLNNQKAAQRTPAVVCAHRTDMQIIVVYGLRFERGKWQNWEHTCSTNDLDGVVDSAKARAADHGRLANPVYMDFLEGARYVFEVAYGSREDPREGDLCVYAVRIDQMVIGDYEELKHYFAHL